MNISVVIPTWDRSNLLKRCIRSVRRYVPHEEIIVIENEYPTARARNMAIAKANPANLIFSIDDDCWFDEELRLLDTIEVLQEKRGWGCCQVTRIMPGMKRARNRELISSPLCWTGGGILFYHDIWECVGGFPEDYLDDVMFSARVYAAGYKNYRSTLSYGHHDVDTTEGGMRGVLDRFGEQGFFPCKPDEYHVTGEPCISKQGIPNIKNIRMTPELKRLHREHREELS